MVVSISLYATNDETVNQIKSILEKELGAWNLNKNYYQVIDVAIEATKKENVCTVGFLLNDNFTENMIKKGGLRDSWEIIQIVFDQEKNIDLIKINMLFMKQDKYGNNKIVTVGMLSISKKEYLKINKKNFYIDILPNVADFLWMGI